MNLGSRNKVSVSFSMSSMTDIVFLLLIFFIVLSTLVSPFGEKVNLPNSSTRTTEKPTVAVTIKPDLSYYIGKELANKESVESILQARAGSEAPQIVLYVDKEVPTGETVEFLALCKKNDWGIVIATQPKKG